ncbi:ABC-2 transporter permease [Mycoplasma sp. P36-A1]|uniref:ABC-2 transporter permease n=1 Tax=Mycoplasma sp. P36-A1 TaxID=3252900 RepID=UPI003C2D906E
MIKQYYNSIIKDFILSRKIILIVCIFMAISFFVQVFIEKDTSISTFGKGVVISLTILNVGLILFAFKNEEEIEFDYLAHFFDLNRPKRIIAKYLFFLIINLFILLLYLVFNVDFLIIGFLVNIIICSITLFTYYTFGSQYLMIMVMVFSGLTILLFQFFPISITNLSNIKLLIPLIGISLYFLSLIFSLILNKLKRIRSYET